MSSRHIPMRRRTRLRGAVAALAAMALPLTMVGAVSGSADAADAPQTWTVLVGNETPNMSVEGMWFLPKDVFIHPGDTVTWKANSYEIHTVTFLDGKDPGTVMPFDPANPADVTREGTSTYDGTSYYNSGLLTEVAPHGDAGPLVPGTKLYSTYSLSFPDPGNFHYLCLVHGMAMQGTVHVLPAGVTLPFTQADYNQQAVGQARYIRLDGRAMLRHFRQTADRHHVIVGGDDGLAASMRFVHRRVRIHRGQTVTFTNPVINGNANMGEPHTVTFGPEKMGPDVIARYGHPWHFHGGQLSSGQMLPGHSFTVRFRKTGTFRYICVLHDGMGMIGSVVVLPKRR